MMAQMKPRTRRLAWIVAGLATLSVATALVLRAFSSNLTYFYTPTEIVQNRVPLHHNFRLGGLVEAGSLARNNGLNVSFRVTDTARTVKVAYTGILPDLFKEGKGVVAEGQMGDDGVFHATMVLAKHDENYMPAESAEALRRAGVPIDARLFAGQKPVVTQAAPGNPAGDPAKSRESAQGSQDTLDPYGSASSSDAPASTTH